VQVQVQVRWLLTSHAPFSSGASATGTSPASVASLALEDDASIWITSPLLEQQQRRSSSAAAAAAAFKELQQARHV
jgi:hypothetical protein